MSLPIRKDFYINESLQKLLEKTTQLTSNKESAVMRTAIYDYCKKMLKDT